MEKLSPYSKEQESLGCDRFRGWCVPEGGSDGSCDDHTLRDIMAEDDLVRINKPVDALYAIATAIDKVVSVSRATLDTSYRLTYVIQVNKDILFQEFARYHNGTNTTVFSTASDVDPQGDE